MTERAIQDTYELERLAAEAEVELASIVPFALPGTPRCHFAFRQDALIWPPEPIAS